MNEVKGSSESAASSSAASELEDGIQHSSNAPQKVDKTDKESEIETLTGLSGELEKKVCPIITYIIEISIYEFPALIVHFCVCSLKICSSLL